MPHAYITTTYGNKFVSPTSRYANYQVMHYGKDKKQTFPIYKKKNLGFTRDDKHFEITKEFEFRPDKVSAYFYSVPDYWWKIMEMNGMKDVLEFRAGRNIVLPGGFLMS